MSTTRPIMDWSDWTDQEIITVIDDLIENFDKNGLDNVSNFPIGHKYGSKNKSSTLSISLVRSYQPLKIIHVVTLISQNPYQSDMITGAVGNLLSNVCHDLHKIFNISSIIKAHTDFYQAVNAASKTLESYNTGTTANHGVEFVISNTMRESDELFSQMIPLKNHCWTISIS